MLERLAEADAGVEDDVPLIHACSHGALRSVGEKVPDLSYHVFVKRISLHTLGLAQHVHEHDWATPLGHEAGHLRVAQSRDVVGYRRPGVEGGLGGRDPVGVDRDHRFGAGRQDSLHHRHHPAQLLLRAYRIRARAGGLATDVYYVRPLVE